ncbi:MAG TPA: T9SS type A sorting domain-containing protein [Candidatus Eisenbacteria bacterium]|nr:T9SS type A sorting domain-containing protein [Candidatus Eisenbacteria bacterium]
MAPSAPSARHLARILTIALGLLAAAPAAAQWTRVTDLPVTKVFSLFSNGDTLAAGVDTAVYFSTNNGVGWRASTKPTPAVTSIQGLWVRSGRIYAGTFGQGVFVSDDRGATWQAFNQGLVGGILDTQLFISDLVVRGDSLYAATSGAGVYVRGLTGATTWSHFGGAFEENQSSNLNRLAVGGSRLLATAPGNGFVFVRDPGDPEWTVSNLDNVGPHGGLASQSVVFTGTAWVVGTNSGIFHSTSGQEPWSRLNPNLGTVNWAEVAVDKQHLFLAFDVVTGAWLEESDDDGASLHNAEFQPGVFVFKLAPGKNDLYAARADGLWRRPLGAVTSVPEDAAPGALQFAVAGRQPFGNGTRLRFQLPRDEAISIELFDVQGRLVGPRIEGWQSAGSHEIALDAGSLGAGVYLARLTAGRTREVVRLIHVR